jgi:hypothetical protein
MEIKASDLRKGVEVDLPIDWSTRPAKQSTIKYIENIDRYVIADIKSGEVFFMSPKLSDVVAQANSQYEHINDTAVED